ncbi:MAG: glycerophosphodiester phosphodiesterase family protein [Anaerolineaceae bacterium]|nr:glycerophosphodiester phosphodiesterase family protein [Anaerolineaceae bacterium]
MLNIAHRGFSGKYPENTLLAFQKALDLGVDAIELDVQLSKDGEIMIFHDEDLLRTTGKQGMLKDLRFDELRELDTSNEYHGEFGYHRIPTLAEYLELTENKAVLTFLELKNSMIPYPGLEVKVADCLQQFRRQEGTILFSANHLSVKYFGTLAPAVQLLFPFDNWIYEYGAYCHKHNISVCMPNFRSLTVEVVAEIKNYGISIYPWTIDEPKDFQSLQQLGVDGILTNHPDRLKTFLEGYHTGIPD